MKDWKFSLGAEVTIACSGEQGTVVGRAEYTYTADSFLVRYKAGDGRAVESWWSADALA